MFNILIVEDDQAISEMLKMSLTANNYDVTVADNGKQTLDHLNRFIPDLLLLDWMLPDTDGPSLIKQIRDTAIHKDLPILMLTARAEEEDKIKGLNTGADDYMTKPVSLQELNARMRALIRRAQGLNSEQKLIHGRISIDLENKTVQIDEENVKIGGMEFRLLLFFMKNTNRLYSRTQLLDSVWGQTVFIEERTVDVHIMRLRKILKAFQLDSKLETVRGNGYRFMVKDGVV